MNTVGCGRDRMSIHTIPNNFCKSTLVCETGPSDCKEDVGKPNFSVPPDKLEPRLTGTLSWSNSIRRIPDL